MTYQQWALIADIYTPMIALACFISILRVMMKGNVQQGFIRLGSVVLSALFIYGVMFLDNALHIWPTFGLDYSTHTAIALVFVAYFNVLNADINVQLCFDYGSSAL
ncbi:hypothetical protein [Photobacterium leiognathi]|uniref:hypothetical protein n=1 Tax=Photobacterium leiognathi TaxID=553611 RepID=UPI00298179AA|nr:hypothetical protein [Photobacterium leiognathi]